MDVTIMKPAKAGGGIRPNLPNRFFTDSNWTAEKKKDGTRILFYIGNLECFAKTRRISKKTGAFMERIDNFPHLTSGKWREILNETVLDGEIMHDSGFSMTQSIVSSSPATAIQKQIKYGWIKYHVFDVLVYNGVDITDKPFKERRKILEELMTIIAKDNDWFCLVNQYPNDKEAFFETEIKAGREGIMLKNLNAGYYDSNAWLKCKRFEDFSMIITGYKLGKSGSKNDGLIASIGVGFYNRKTKKFKQVTYASGLSNALMEKFTENPELYLNKVCEVRAEKLLPSGSLRHPRFRGFRDDVDIIQCTSKQNVRLINDGKEKPGCKVTGGGGGGYQASLF